MLDSQNAKAVPGICLTCHGGGYDPSLHLAKDANFLPFDAPSFIFSSSALSLIESSQREAIRQLNGFVEETAPARQTITQLIYGWYNWCGGVGKTGCYIDDVGHPFYPNNQPCSSDPTATSCGWPATWGGANAQSFYQRVPRVYCRTCHVAQSNHFNVNNFEHWSALKTSIQSDVFSTHFMPFAEVPYNGFWQDFQAQSALKAFLNASGP